jgi:hypothetical protein
VSAKALQISWSQTEDAAAYIVEIESDTSEFTATFPATITSIRVPDDLLRPDAEYDLAIGTVDRRGNISYIETSFRTAAAE